MTQADEAATAVSRRPADLEDLGNALRRLQRLLSSRKVAGALADAADVALSTQEIAVLTALGSDTVTVAELARLAAMDVGAVSRQLSGLDAAGLVRKAVNPDNRAVVFITATDEGRVQAERVVRVRDAHLARALAGWSSDDRRAIGELLARLVADVAATPYDAAGDPDDHPVMAGEAEPISAGTRARRGTRRGSAARGRASGPARRPR
jgi:DNA-binding MarR family transcriptional regulator